MGRSPPVLSLVALASVVGHGASTARAEPAEWADTVRVRVEGFSEEDLALTRVEIVTRSTRFRWDRVPLARRERGWFVIHTSALARANETDDCDLVVEHPDCEPERRPLMLPRTLDGRVVPGLVRVDAVALERPTVLLGRVVDGVPSSVEVLAIEHGNAEPLVTAKTDAAGSYRLRLRPGEPRHSRMIEVVATSPGRATASVDVLCTPAARNRVPDLVLEEPLALGRADVTGLDVENALVEASWLGEPPTAQVAVDGDVLRRVEGRWQRTSAFARPTVADWFGLGGLGVGVWRVRLHPGAERLPVHPDLAIARTAVVRLPDSDLRVGAPARTVRWTVESPDGPVCNAVIVVEGEHGRLWVRTDFYGGASARLRADRAHEVGFAAGRCAFRDERLEQGGDEDRRVRLEHGDAPTAWFPSTYDRTPVHVLGTDGVPLSAPAAVLSADGVVVSDTFFERLGPDAWIEWKGRTPLSGPARVGLGTSLVVGGGLFGERKVDLRRGATRDRATWLEEAAVGLTVRLVAR